MRKDTGAVAAAAVAIPAVTGNETEGSKDKRTNRRRESGTEGRTQSVRMDDVQAAIAGVVTQDTERRGCRPRWARGTGCRTQILARQGQGQADIVTEAKHE